MTEIEQRLVLAEEQLGAISLPGERDRPPRKP